MLPIELTCRRKALGMSQEELGEAISAKQATISRWEKGQRPIPEGLDQTLAALENATEAMYDEICMNTAAGDPTHAINPQPIPVVTYRSDHAFWSDHPLMHGMPHTLHSIAAARALATHREINQPLTLVEQGTPGAISPSFSPPRTSDYVQHHTPLPAWFTQALAASKVRAHYGDGWWQLCEHIDWEDIVDAHPGRLVPDDEHCSLNHMPDWETTRAAINIIRATGHTPYLGILLEPTGPLTVTFFIEYLAITATGPENLQEPSHQAALIKRVEDTLVTNIGDHYQSRCRIDPHELRLDAIKAHDSDHRGPTTGPPLAMQWYLDGATSTKDSRELPTWFNHAAPEACHITFTLGPGLVHFTAPLDPILAYTEANPDRLALDDGRHHAAGSAPWDHIRAALEILANAGHKPTLDLTLYEPRYNQPTHPYQLTCRAITIDADQPQPSPQTYEHVARALVWDPKTPAATRIRPLHTHEGTRWETTYLHKTPRH